MTMQVKPKEEIEELLKTKQVPHFTDEQWNKYVEDFDYVELLTSVNPPMWAVEYIPWTKEMHINWMYEMRDRGWWELNWEVFPGTKETQELIAIEFKKMFLKDLLEQEYTFPSLLVELNLFKSNKEAKKNGWNKPLEKGDFFFKKKTYVLRIV